jgi:hypothetical protein
MELLQDIKEQISYLSGKLDRCKQLLKEGTETRADIIKLLLPHLLTAPISDYPLAVHAYVLDTGTFCGRDAGDRYWNDISGWANYVGVTPLNKHACMQDLIDKLRNAETDSDGISNGWPIGTWFIYNGYTNVVYACKEASDGCYYGQDDLTEYIKDTIGKIAKDFTIVFCDLDSVPTEQEVMI